MHIKKQVVSILLVLTLVFSFIPTSVWADEGVEETPAPTVVGTEETPSISEDESEGGTEGEPASEPAGESDGETEGEPAGEPAGEPDGEPGGEGEPDQPVKEAENQEDLSTGVEDEFQSEIITEEEQWEITRVFPVPSLRMAARSAVSSTTAYLNTSDFPYTNTSSGQRMAVHWIRGSDGYLEFAWCIEPSKSAVNGDTYAFETESSAQRVADVLQLGYEWGYWGGMQSNGLPTYTAGHAAVQIAIWRAMGYTAVCSDSSVNSMAASLLSAAINDDPGCGGGAIYQYRCTSNSSRQRLITYDPQRAVTVEYGNVKLKKASANTQITNGNSCYDLAGAVYGVYSSRNNALNDRNRLGTLTTKANGESNILYSLEAGYSYFVKELTAPKGYALDSTVYTISVKANKTNILSVTDIPQSDPVGVLLKKVDATTGKGETRS